MTTKYLIDASALHPLAVKLGENILDHTEKFRVLDLTMYEVGNVLWKEKKRGRIADIESAASFFEELLRNMYKLSIDNIGEVLSIALEKNLSFYDVAYIYVAEKNKLKLVTEDKEILHNYDKAINTSKLLEEIDKRITNQK